MSLEKITPKMSAQTTPLHPRKQAKNARGEGGCHVQCAIWEGRGGQ